MMLTSFVSVPSYVLTNQSPQSTTTSNNRYILIEGKTELAVRQAKRELQRILDEETLRVGVRPQFGRYSVV